MPNPDYIEMLRLLNASGARYLVVGAHAVIYYTEPRFTGDLDLWIDRTPGNARLTFQALLEFGAPVEGMQSVLEQAAQEHRSRGRAVYLRFVLTELAGLVAGLGVAWAAKLTGRAYLYDRLLVRPATVPSLPGEVQEAQDRLNVHLNSLLHAISHHQFLQARLHAAEEQKAREELRRLREKYNIAESGDML